MNAITDYFDFSPFVKPYEDRIIELALRSVKEKDIDTKVGLLKRLISEFYAFKGACSDKGSKYEDYFSRMWEHCRGSRSSDHCYIVKFEQELKALLMNYDSIKAAQALHDEKASGLDLLLLKTIEDHSGILQKDIYTLFDPVIKADVQEMLYFWEREGRILREKSGSTYKLYLKSNHGCNAAK